MFCDTDLLFRCCLLVYRGQGSSSTGMSDLGPKWASLTPTVNLRSFFEIEKNTDIKESQISIVANLAYFGTNSSTPDTGLDQCVHLSEAEVSRGEHIAWKLQVIGLYSCRPISMYNL